MKSLLTLIMLIFGIASCQKKNHTDINAKSVKNDVMKDETIYTVKISAANPYEIYVNDMPLEKDYENGSSNTEIPINDFILKSGIQNIRVVLLPNKGGVLVDKLGMEHFEVKVNKYTKGILNLNPDDATLLKSINLKESKEMPIVQKEIKINLTVPYEVKGWSESVDLSKENQEKLKTEVLAKYDEIKNLINEGNFSEFSKKYKLRNKEVNESYYNNPDAIKDDYEWMKKRISNSKGHMKSITNFSVKLNGNNRIVYLENEDHESPLISDDGKSEEVYNILLHRPKPNAPLEIIR